MATSSEEDSQDDGEQNQNISGDEGLPEHHKDDQHKRETTTAQVSGDEYIPYGIVQVVNAMIKELNDTRINVNLQWNGIGKKKGHVNPIC